MLKVLFVDHTSELSGAEIALLRLIRSLDRNPVQPSVLLFSDGPLAEELRKLDISPIVYPLPSRLLQIRKSTPPTLSTFLVRGQSSLLFAVKLAQFLHHHPFDLIHTNSLKADLLGGLAARLAGKPLLWHIHDRIEADYLPRRTVKLFRALCRKLPHYLVANSYATLETLHLPLTKPSSVIYSGVDRS